LTLESHFVVLQVSLSLGGRVRCLSASSCTDAVISLTPRGASRVAAAKTSPDGEGRFAFYNLQPGLYEISAASSPKGFCYEPASQEAVLGSTSRSDLSLQQTGYVLDLSSRVWPFTIRWRHQSGAAAGSGSLQVTEQLAKHSNARVCLPLEGTYDLHYEGCYGFPAAPSSITLPLPTSHKGVVRLDATEFLVEVLVRSAQSKGITLTAEPLPVLPAKQVSGGVLFSFWAKKVASCLFSFTYHCYCRVILSR
jgi:hypothetical protein